MRSTALKNEKVMSEEVAPRKSVVQDFTNPKNWEPNRALQVISSQLHEPNQQQDSSTSLLDQPLADRLLNAREVAHKLGVSERWVRDHTTRRSPKIRALKLGTLVRYRWTDVELFMEISTHCNLHRILDLVYEEIVLHDQDQKQIRRTYGNEVSEGHRLPSRAEGENVVRKIPDLWKRPRRKGGSQAP
jgi:predicted DNA-binding transcriptional regulator AlpA